MTGDEALSVSLEREERVNRLGGVRRLRLHVVRDILIDEDYMRDARTRDMSNADTNRQAMMETTDLFWGRDGRVSREHRIDRCCFHP